MAGTGAGHAAGKDLRPLGHETAQTGHVFVVDGIDFIHAKLANLTAALPASAAARAFGSLKSHEHWPPFLKRSERQIVIPDNFLKIARIGGGKSRGRFAVLGNLGIIPGAAGRRSACIFGFSKESVVDNHLKGRAFVAILIGVVPGLQRALQRDALSLVEIPADELGSLPPGDAVDEIRLTLLRTLGLECRSTATLKLVTAVSVWVRRSSGSVVSRPSKHIMFMAFNLSICSFWIRPC